MAFACLTLAGCGGGSGSGSAGSTDASTTPAGPATPNETPATVEPPAAVTPSSPTANGWVLAWSDEFNGTVLDPAVWTHDIGAGGWGNNESQYYLARNAVVKDGYLTITAKREAVGDAPYTSARIQTSNKKTFTYGRFEIRAKLPATQGMWPAFWLLGTRCNSFNLYGGNQPWPVCGEIDAMEMIGGLADGSGDYTTHGTLHYRNAAGNNPAPSVSWRSPTRLSDGFHVYALEWTPQSFTWYIDGVAYGTTLITDDMAVFHQPFFLLLNLAVGGAWGGWANASTVFPQTYVIDYVRHYTRAAPPAGTAAGLPSVWHMLDTPQMQSAQGTASGAGPLVTLGSQTLSWFTPLLTGTYEGGAWLARIWTLAGSASSTVRARLYRQSADGTTAVLLGESVMDPSKTGGGNHATAFSFPGVAAQNLRSESLRLDLTKLSGADIRLIVNGNDFDSRLSGPWSASGNVAGYPSTSPFPSEPAQSPAGAGTGGQIPAVATRLGVYSDAAMEAMWSGLTTPSGYAGGSVQAASSGAYEGSSSLACVLSADGSGWQFVGAPTDLTPYRFLRFMIRTASPAHRVWVRMASTGPVGRVALSDNLSASTDWQEVVIPLSAFGPAASNATSVPFGLEVLGGSTTFSAQIDRVYFSVD